MINKILFHIFNIFKESPLSKDCLHKGSDTVPSITKYCHKHTQSVLFPTPHKKDLRLKWVSVPLWQQCFCWRHTMHRKGTKKTTEKWHLVLLGHKLGRKPSRVSCSSVAFCIILCCLMPQFRCSVCSLRVLGWSTWSLPHRGGYRQTDAESLSIPSYNFSLHPTFPVLSNSSPPAGQDHGTSGRHNYEGTQVYGFGFASQQLFRSVQVSPMLHMLFKPLWSHRCIYNRVWQLSRHVTVLGPFWQ